MNDIQKQPDNDEPDLGADESIPLDGKDPVGEKMIEELGRKSPSESESRSEPDSEKTDPGPLPKQLPVS